jgi:hypothetical protein
MDPTDPALAQPGSSVPGGDSPAPEEGGGGKEVEYTDFAEVEPDEPHEAGESKATPGQWIWMILLPLGFTFLLTLLFLAMRGVMDLGGMVAKGGPYEIAHPAPDYWWIFPVSIIGMLIIVFSSMGMFSFMRGMTGSVSSPFSGQGVLSRGGGVSLVALLFWPAIFFSLGWNFCEYGFFAGDGLVWGWVICGVVFILMGGFPLYLVAKRLSWHDFLSAVAANRRSLWPQVLGIAAGIPLGILFFNAVS